VNCTRFGNSFHTFFAAPPGHAFAQIWYVFWRRNATVTDQERQKAEELISRLELSVGQIFPRDGGNAALLTSMIQTLNGLRSLLGIVRPH
jgi:hypothetical protein